MDTNLNSSSHESNTTMLRIHSQDTQQFFFPLIPSSQLPFKEYSVTSKGICILSQLRKEKEPAGGCSGLLS